MAANDGEDVTTGANVTPFLVGKEVGEEVGFLVLIVGASEGFFVFGKGVGL